MVTRWRSYMLEPPSAVNFPPRRTREIAARRDTAAVCLTMGRTVNPFPARRLHGLVTRLPGTHRYRVTEPGLRLALFLTRVHARLFRPGLSLVLPDATQHDAPLRRAFTQLERAMDQWCAEAKLAA